MILLSHLPDDMFTLASTITQTVAVANFDLETVASRILAEIDLWATRRPLASQISAIQSEESSVNRTTVIWRSPPPQNQWKGQTNSYQRPLQQYQGNQSGYQNHQGSGLASQPMLRLGTPNSVLTDLVVFLFFLYLIRLTYNSHAVPMFLFSFHIMLHALLIAFIPVQCMAMLFLSSLPFCHHRAVASCLTSFPFHGRA